MAYSFFNGLCFSPCSIVFPGVPALTFSTDNPAAYNPNKPLPTQIAFHYGILPQQQNQTKTVTFNIKHTGFLPERWSVLSLLYTPLLL